MDPREAPRPLVGAAVLLFAAGCAGQATPGWTYGPAFSTPASPPAAAPSGAPPAASPSGPAGSPAASGSGGGSTAPAGAVIRIAARNIAFDQAQLTAPANTPFQIVFDNQENGIPHNVAIYTDASAGQALFIGAIFPGPAERTYDVPALKPGSYFYRCDVHPVQMTGTLVVQ